MTTTSTTHEHHAALTRLRAWVLEQNADADPSRLAFDTPLLEERWLTSLQLTDLLLLIEELRNSPIDVEDLRPGVFRDLQTICLTFLSGA